jgi:hypothetical protein
VILPGGQVCGAFESNCLPIGLLACQVLFTDESNGSRTLDLVSLERSSTRSGQVEAGAPFTVRWAVEPISKAMCEAIVSKWACDGATVIVLCGVTDVSHWILLRAPTEQLVLHVT